MSPMSTTLDWIIACERQGLLTSADVRRFRQLAEISGDDFSSRVVLKWLTTRDRITAEQADQILSGPPDLSPVESIIRVLGDASNESAEMELEPERRELDETEEDTKDLSPLDPEEVGELVLPPRGSPAFAGTVTAPKPNTAAVAVKSPEPVVAESLPISRNYSSAIDELLADAGTESAQLPNLKTQPMDLSRFILGSPVAFAATVALAVVALTAILILWRASR